MFRPAAFFIGLRYTRAKRRNRFISFVAATSMFGIALGVMVLITVLSVMNGFDRQIKERVFGMANQMSVSTVTGVLPNWQTLAQQVHDYPGIVASSPYVQGQAMLLHIGLTHPVLVQGILPSQEKNISQLSQKMVVGKLTDLKPHQFGIVLGQELAESLGLTVGQHVTVLIPQFTVNPLEVAPRFRQFTVVGIFQIGNGFGFDSQLAFIDLQDAQALYQLGSTVTGLQLKITDLYNAPTMAKALQKHLAGPYTVSNWTERYGALFSAIAMEKTMMFVILILIIAVAAFNLVSSLVMMVTDKQADIAILRTLGATPRTILTIFIVQGSVIGIIGTLAGLLSGVLLATHVTELVNWLQQILGVQFLASNVYYVNYLPSHLSWLDVLRVCIIALSMSLLATLYPAWRAAKIQPAEALRYE